MKENYHYAGLIIEVASFAKNIDLTHEINSEGEQRTTIYNIKSNDSHNINFNINLNTYQTHPTELQEKLYRLVSYVKNTNSNGKSVSVCDDDQMFKCVVDFANANSDKLSYFLNKYKDNVSLIAPYYQPMIDISEKRLEIEHNFLPLAREHIAFLIAEFLAKQSFTSFDTTLVSELKNQIRSALNAVGCNDKFIDEMFNQNKQIQPSSPLQMQ